MMKFLEFYIYVLRNDLYVYVCVCICIYYFCYNVYVFKIFNFLI